MTDIYIGLAPNANPICDFCSSEQVVTDYDCIDYTIPVTGPDGKKLDLGSSGKWAACRECAALVDRNDHEGLLNRAAAAFALNHGFPDDWIGEEMLKFLSELHEKFWKGRKP